MMAEGDSAQFSLLTLEEELTCSICLSTFVHPVTTPCGHNFCQECLLATWKDSYCCPQCRTVFATKPELKKNTVLCTVVDTFNQRAKKEDKVEVGVEDKAEVNGVLCDTCMQAEAMKTCLTCMASFCEQHLRPHQVNPIYSVHQLSEPIADLKERICSQHHKLMELFCSQHLQPICSQCLQAQHRGCPFTSPEEQRSMKESDLRGKLAFLDRKISQTETILAEMRDKQNRLKDSGTNRKKMISAEYQQMRDMLTKEESDALNGVEREVESGQSKFKNLAKKFNENINNMSTAKDEIHSLLSGSNTMAFLQASFVVPQAASFDPYAPRINLDSKKVIVSSTFAAALKEHLAEILKQPLEARLPITGTGERRGGASKPPSYGSHQDFDPFGVTTRQGSYSPSKPGVKKKPAEHMKRHGKSNEGGIGCTTKSMENLLEFGTVDMVAGAFAAAQLQEKQPDHLDFHLNMSPPVKRSELLKFGTVLTLDMKTAHKRIVLSEGFTKALVTDEHMNYPDNPKRFAVCSQVLASKGFSTGRHYWEVRVSSNNFIGIGLAYSSIDRKGPTSRLGRNAQSWCVEWFNVKLSAWHNNSETVLVNPSPKRIGVLLDCKEGTATFYSVADRAYAFHTFVFPFVEAVYPAFWIFSSGSSITLCKLQE